MAKFRIEDNPTFTVDVAVNRAGGSIINVPFTFKYFSQDELYPLREEWQKRRVSARDEVEGRDVTIAELKAMNAELEALELLEIVDSWEFDVDPSEESMRKFVNAIDGNYESAMKAFIGGLAPARLGN